MQNRTRFASRSALSPRLRRTARAATGPRGTWLLAFASAACLAGTASCARAQAGSAADASAQPPAPEAPASRSAREEKKGDAASPSGDRPASAPRNEAQPRELPPVPSNPSPVSPALLASRLRHVRDANGRSGKFEVSLLFHPSGTAFLLFEGAGARGFAHQGTFSFEKGELELNIPRPGGEIHFRGPVNLGARTVVLPFSVFSRNAGSSTWEFDDDRWRLVTITCLLAHAVALTHPTPGGEIPAEAIERALDEYLAPLRQQPGSRRSLAPAPMVELPFSYDVSKGGASFTFGKDGSYRLALALATCLKVE
jgi:hypothetical protein